MDRTQLSSEVHRLASAIWGKKRVGRGYNWLAAKFGSMNQEKWTQEKYEAIIQCLQSKLDGAECPVHKRAHEKLSTASVDKKS